VSWRRVLIASVLLAVVAGVLVAQRRARPRFERQIPWAGAGVWLRAETHVHSTFSDGSHTIDELADPRSRPLRRYSWTRERTPEGIL
jgi:hypothetical protein